MLFLTTAGAVAMWPADWSVLGSVPTSYEGAQWVSAEVVRVDPSTGTAAVIVAGQESAGEQELLPADLGTFTYEPGIKCAPCRLTPAS